VGRLHRIFKAVVKGTLQPLFRLLFRVQITFTCEDPPSVLAVQGNSSESHRCQTSLAVLQSCFTNWCTSKGTGCLHAHPWGHWRENTSFHFLTSATQLVADRWLAKRFISVDIGSVPILRIFSNRGEGALRTFFHFDLAHNALRSH